MSWNVSVEGTQEMVKEKVAADPHIPEPIARAIDAVLEPFNVNEKLVFTTDGHVDIPAGTGNASIRVKTAG